MHDHRAATVEGYNAKRWQHIEENQEEVFCKVDSDLWNVIVDAPPEDNPAPGFGKGKGRIEQLPEAASQTAKDTIVEIRENLDKLIKERPVAELQAELREEE